MKVGIVQLYGELGNQIFNYAFGQYLINNEYSVYFDRLSGFVNSKNRDKLDEVEVI